MFTLGINAVFHDSSACLVKDGIVVAAAEEERFTHKKHAKRPIPFSCYELPYHAIDYCLREGGITLTGVDHVAYSFNPRKLLGGRAPRHVIQLPLRPAKQRLVDGESLWNPLFIAFVLNAPNQLADGAPHHLQSRFKGARRDGPYRWHFIDHHVAHAASAFHASPFESSAVLTLDGRGEKDTTSYSHGSGVSLKRLGQVEMPNSLGLLYEKVTTYLGFLHASDEYKVMALASYGKPRFVREFQEIVRLGANGQFFVEAPDLENRFGPPRVPNSEFLPKHFDVARSLQFVLEETVLELAKWLRSESGDKNLSMAGGVALNCVMNARLRDAGLFSNVWVQPAAGDAGTSLGAALWVDSQEREPPRRTYVMEHAYLGPGYSDGEVREVLERAKIPYLFTEYICEEAADLLAQNKIIGWFQGRMEFGPRALGARSILASPLDAAVQQKLNDIKDREDFRPVAPVVLEEEASEWFLQAGVSPFMLFVSDVLPEKADKIPAVRHVDGTARVQTLNRTRNAVTYDLLKAFQRRTGVPILVNTSFNTRGQPIVCTPEDALQTFWTSSLDALAIGSFLIQKPAPEAQTL